MPKSSVESACPSPFRAVIVGVRQKAHPFFMKTSIKIRPLALRLAKRTKSSPVAGAYQSVTQTWSDRDYADSAPKKHSEDR